MARAVVLHFDDNAVAANFVRSLDATGAVCLTADLDGKPYARVEAVVGVPTRWCKCRTTAEATSRSAARRKARKDRIEGSGWTRGVKFGWWLCGTCHKPSKPVCDHWYTGMLNGANDLLREILGTGDSETPSQRFRRLGGVGTAQVKVGDHYEHL